jgi:signal transduction histidine kinase
LIAAAVAFGPRVGVVLALAMGAASFVGEGLVSDVDAGWGVTASSKTGLYVLAAAVAGFVADRLRHAEREVSTARAREEIARTLHDGVLQTLAVVQRRSDDTALVSMAREQDQELRAFLFGTGSAGDGTAGDAPTLAAALRDVAARTERHHGVATAAVIADDLPDLPPGHVDAIAGAVGEALTNAAKHAEANRIVVFAEPDDDGGVFCSVKDDGVGFDPDSPSAGQGIARSIQARMHEAGGTAEITSRPGSGTEVRLRVPAAAPTRGRR